MADSDTNRTQSRSNNGTGYIYLNCRHYTTKESSLREQPVKVLGDGRRHRGQYWCDKCLGWRKEMK